MDEIAAEAIAIFAARADSTGPLCLDTRLADLDIESLDLALILLDIEDAFGIDFPYDPAEAATTLDTVGAVVERARERLDTKQGRRLTSLAASLERPKSRWVTASGRA